MFKKREDLIEAQLADAIYAMLSSGVVNQPASPPSQEPPRDGALKLDNEPCTEETFC